MLGACKMPHNCVLLSQLQSSYSGCLLLVPCTNCNNRFGIAEYAALAAVGTRLCAVDPGTASISLNSASKRQDLLSSFREVTRPLPAGVSPARTGFSADECSDQTVCQNALSSLVCLFFFARPFLVLSAKDVLHLACPADVRVRSEQEGVPTARPAFIGFSCEADITSCDCTSNTYRAKRSTYFVAKKSTCTQKTSFATRCNRAHPRRCTQPVDVSVHIICTLVEPLRQYSTAHRSLFMQCWQS